MCNILLRDPTNAFWQLSIQNDGTLQSTKIAIAPIRMNDPILKGSFKAWTLTADFDGTIVATPTPLNNPLALQYVPMIAPNGQAFKLIILDIDGTLETFSVSPAPADFIPTPIDVTMSNWPVSAGVFCISCGNASVTARGDLSLWCCTCNSYVLPEDTNILVALDE